MRTRQSLRRAVPPILGCLILAGCAASPWAIPTPCTESALLRQYAAWERLAPEQIDAAYAQAREAFERAGDDCDRLHVALLTVLQGSRRNEAYTLKILDEYLAPKRGADDPRTTLVRLLNRMLRERVEGEARSRAALKKAADEQARADACKRQVTEEQGRADACKRQLDELRNVEKIIDERGAR